VAERNIYSLTCLEFDFINLFISYDPWFLFKY